MHEHDDPDLRELKPIQLNRRETVRLPSGGTAVAIAEKGYSRVVTSVAIRDACVKGLGLISPMPLPVGGQIRLHFNGSSLPGRSGTIVRCDRDTSGFEVGVICDAAVVAA